MTVTELLEDGQLLQGDMTQIKLVSKGKSIEVLNEAKRKLSLKEDQSRIGSSLELFKADIGGLVHRKTFLI